MLAPKLALLLCLLSVVAHAEECGNIMCGSDETCCKDSPTSVNGTECCLKVSRMCVPIRAGFATSTCCPKWTVGCSAGSVGCCDPARPWQLAAGQSETSVQALPEFMRQPGRSVTYDDSSAFDAQVKTNAQQDRTATAYAMFPHDSKNTIKALSLDASSGHVVNSVDVDGPFVDYYNLFGGQDTRVIAWAPKLQRFVHADVDQQNTDQTIVYTVDPATGNSTSTNVEGCTGYPVGIAWDEEAQALMLGMQNASHAWFCSVDVDTGKATSLFSVARGSEEQSATYYAAYISVASGGTAMRIGNKMVTQGSGLGLSVINATTSTWTDVSLDADHSDPLCSQVYNGQFVSLAQRVSHSLIHDLDVVRWFPADPTVSLANLTDAHPPLEPYVRRQLGYVADSITGSTYGALTVAQHKSSGVGLGDRWAVSTLDLNSGAVTQKHLFPQPSLGGAESASLIGFGLIPQQE